MSLNALTLLLGLVSAICLAGAYYAARHFNMTSSASVAMLLVFMAVWALGAAAEMLAVGYAAKRIFLGVTYIGIAFVPPAWLRFMLEHTTHRDQGHNPVVRAVFVLSGVFLLSNWYNPFSLFYRTVQVVEIDGAGYILPTYGPLFVALMALNYGTLAVMVVSMWVRCVRGEVERHHVALITIGAGAPVLLNLLYIGRIVAFDITPLGFAISVAALALLNKSAFFAELPISRRKLFETIGDGIVLLNGSREVVDINGAGLQMLGLEPGPPALTGAQSHIFSWQQTAEHLEDNLRFVQAFDHPARGRRYYRVSVNALASRAGEARGTMLLLQDETALYKAQERIRYLENYDSVTGLMGRPFFTRLLSQELEQCASLPQSNAVLCVSIVNYSDYCHMYGSDFGEALQREVGIRMQGMLRKYDAISRFSEDEFYLCFRYESNVGNPGQNTLRVIDRLTSLFSTPVVVGDVRLAIRLRCGAAFCPQHSSSADKLIAMSKMAQLHATKAGGRLYYCYDESMGLSMSRYLRLEQCLRTALARGELSVVYHPQIELSSGRVAGAEALLRWNSPELGPVSPAEFIQVAEDTGDIREIGMWVIGMAVRQILRWHRIGICDVRVAVNVSLSQLTDRCFADQVIAMVEESGIDPGLLELEVTESMALSAEALTFGHLPRLRAHGIRLAMDDFGMGHSSLSYIKQFDLDTIKIDRVLSQDMLKSPASVAMIRSVNTLCRDLGMDIVVEFIEEKAQVDLLAAMGCGVVQGYFFTPPLAPDACTAYIMNRHNQLAVKRLADAGH